VEFLQLGREDPHPDGSAVQHRLRLLGCYGNVQDRSVDSLKSLLMRESEAFNATTKAEISVRFLLPVAATIKILTGALCKIHCASSDEALRETHETGRSRSQYLLESSLLPAITNRDSDNKAYDLVLPARGGHNQHPGGRALQGLLRLLG
jgi:hypothetical protein